MVWNKCTIQTMEIRTRKIETKSSTANDVGIERRQNVACDREHPQSWEMILLCVVVDVVGLAMVNRHFK